MSENKKDFWDVLNITSTLLIAGMIGYWGYSNQVTQEKNQNSYNQKMASLESQRIEIEKLTQEYSNISSSLELELRKQEQITASLNKDEDQQTHKLAVIQTLIPHITNTEKSRKVAIIVLSKLGQNDIALEFASLYEDSSSKEAGDEILQFGKSDEQKDHPEPKRIISTIDESRLKEGWMYLGRREGGKWNGNYTALNNSKSLEALVGTVVAVKTSVSGVNVRTSYPSVFGKLRPVIDTLQPGSRIKIGEKSHYTFNDFIWVNIKYSEPKS